MYYGSQIDFPFLLTGSNADIQIFVNPNTGTGSYYQWNKPRGAVLVYGFVAGGAGGGGGGFTGATTVARGGGGGGSSGGAVAFIAPAFTLPDRLFIAIGAGGAGSTGSGVAGSPGNVSAISFGAGTSSVLSGANIYATGTAGNGGAAGTGAAAGTGGSAPSSGNQRNNPWGAYNLGTASAGLAGANGGVQTGAIGVAINALALQPYSGGGGGAGVNAVNTGFAGGLINSTSQLDYFDFNLQSGAFITGGIAGGVGAAGNGQPGYVNWKLLLFTGGSGGGSSDKSNGGIGGQGGPASGGGGGGAGATGGAGGKGGDGFVIIVATF